MAHDVFISYASENKPIADAVCATLEARRIRCWIAPRDILPSDTYGHSIIDAIETSRLLILILSADSNRSPQVMREVERAVSKGLLILPFRIEDVPLSGDMEYFISSAHWLDALTPPREQQMQRLAETAALLIARTGDAPPAADRQEPPPPSAGPRSPEPASPGALAARVKPTRRVPLAAIWLGIAVVAVGSLWRIRTAAEQRTPAGKLAACTRNLQAIGRALAAYQRDKGELPPHLADLYPQYLSDERIFYCPAAPPPAKPSSEAKSASPRLPVSYFYEMSLDPNPPGIVALGPAPGGDGVTRLQMKQSQVPNYGDRVPVVNCGEHARPPEQGQAAGFRPVYLRLLRTGEVCRSESSFWELDPATVPAVLTCLERDLAAGPELVRSHWQPDRLEVYFAQVPPLPALRDRYRAAAARLEAMDHLLPGEAARDVPPAAAAIYRAAGDDQKALEVCDATSWRLKAHPHPRFFPIDLRRHITHHLTDDLVADSPGNNFSGLSAGRQILAGVLFQVDGVAATSRGRPIKGIPVGRKADRFHFMQSAYFTAPTGEKIGAYLLHYADGTQAEIPIRAGVDVVDWWNAGRMLRRAEVAWCGKNDQTGNICFYMRTWQNPRPAVAVRSLDLLPGKSVVNPRAAPMLAAVTCAQDPA